MQNFAEQKRVSLCSANAWIGTHATFPVIPKRCCRFSVVQSFQFEFATHPTYIQGKHLWSIDQKYNYRECWCYIICITEDFVRRTILSSPLKTCELDAFPTPLLLECLDSLLPCITAVFNNSLVSGVFPSVYKSALVKPLLKKMSLDPDDLKNYRPVSNLSFLSKILERIVLSQLNEHLNHNNLLSPLQSAYRPNHSTETALLRIVNDLLTAMDNNKICILTLLDLSAAFDTIDHQILLTRLRHSFGISGPALSWFSSYLSNRTHAVTINSLQSEHTTLHYGVPQGSVLGPVLFILYTQPLFNLVCKQAVSHHAFTDDNQLYKISTLDAIHQSIETPDLHYRCQVLDDCKQTSSKWQKNWSHDHTFK